MNIFLVSTFSFYHIITATLLAVNFQPIMVKPGDGEADFVLKFLSGLIMIMERRFLWRSLCCNTNLKSQLQHNIGNPEWCLIV